nr:type I-E CRISPR-associated protein Cse2/CasB [Leptolyngbya sp. FACHB-321]
MIRICQDRAVRSALRPLLAGIPDMQIRAMRYLPRNAPVNQDLLYLIAGLVAEYPCSLPEPNNVMSFGASLYKLSQHPDIKATGIERRLESLLQLELDSLMQPLHSLVVQFSSTQSSKTSIVIDYATLLYHLRCWDDSRKWVQLTWARDFWCPKEDGKEQNSDETLDIVKS